MIKDTIDHADPFDEAEHKEFSAWFLQYEIEFVPVNRPKLKARRRKSGVTRVPGSQNREIKSRGDVVVNATTKSN